MGGGWEGGRRMARVGGGWRGWKEDGEGGRRRMAKVGGGGWRGWEEDGKGTIVYILSSNVAMNIGVI